MHGYHDDYYWIPDIADGVHRAEHDRLEPRRQPDAEPRATPACCRTPPSSRSRYSGFWLHSSNDPNEDGQARVQTRFVDDDTGLITGGISSWAESRSWRYGLSAKLSQGKEQLWGGSHDLKIGVQYGGHGSDNLNGPNDTITTFSVTGRPSRGTTQLPYHQGANVNWIGAYVDDTYRVGRGHRQLRREIRLQPGGLPVAAVPGRRGPRDRADVGRDR